MNCLHNGEHTQARRALSLAVTSLWRRLHKVESIVTVGLSHICHRRSTIDLSGCKAAGIVSFRLSTF